MSIFDEELQNLDPNFLADLHAQHSYAANQIGQRYLEQRSAAQLEELRFQAEQRQADDAIALQLSRYAPDSAPARAIRALQMTANQAFEQGFMRGIQGVSYPQP